MISFENVFFSYDKKTPVLSDFSLDIQEGRRVCLLGPSGKGKTTILRMALGLIRPDRGLLAIREGASPSAVFQEDRLIPWRTVLDNVALFADKEKNARAMLRDLGLGDVTASFPSELSGGMKRRTSLARALCHRFDYLVLDEPFTGLDDETRKVCIGIVDRELAKRPLLFSTHDLREAHALNAEIVTLA